MPLPLPPTLTGALHTGRSAPASGIAQPAPRPAPSSLWAVAVDPNSELPGTAQLTGLVGGLMTWVLLACVVAILVGAAAWGFGARSGHYGATQQGRMMVLGGAAGAMIAGAATAVVNFGFGLGSAVH